MSFRRTRDEWDEFLKRHGPRLRACGVPDSITRDRGRFLRFVLHGCDEDARHDTPPFSPDLMTPEQAAQLATLILQHLGEQAGWDLLPALRRRAHEA
jgi:hypothetical protein